MQNEYFVLPSFLISFSMNTEAIDQKIDSLTKYI